MNRFAYLLAALALIALLISSQPSSQQEYDEEWWNGSWHYRVKITVNTTKYEREFWPVEYDVNFTRLLEDLNLTEDFDENSTRVLEVNASGDVLWEVPSQFDKDIDYNESNNAEGTLVFILNGTTSGNTLRWFYVYFDTVEHSKSAASYNSVIDATTSGDEFNVTFSNEADYYGFFVFDTQRGENTSGLYQYRYLDEYRFTYSTGGQKTREFVQLTDGTTNYGFDLRNNMSITEGPARVKVSQEGYETYWNQADNRTNMTYLRKTYYFYPNKTWFLMEHEIININSSAVTRWSYAGISGFDLLGAYGSGYKWSTNYTQDPGSFVSGSASLGTERGGYAHLWENGTSNFAAGNSTSGGSPNYDRIGINLSTTTLQPGESIQDRAVMVFYHTVNSPTLLPDTMNRLMNEINITEGEPEMWVVKVEPKPDHEIYNRNESAVLWANMTRDDWGIVDHVNATLDMGTPASGDDVTIQLLDDGNYPDSSAGDSNYTAYYNFSNSEATGYWNMTVRAYDADGGLLNESYYTFNITAELEVSIDIWNATGIWRLENATINVSNFRQDIMIPGATLNCTTNYQQIPSQNITDHGDGTYTVTFETPVNYGLYPLNCSAEKDGSWGFQLENYTVEAPNTSISLKTQPDSFDAYNVSFYGNESFNLRVTLQNIENSTAYQSNITLYLPPELSANSTFEECGQILIDLSCVRDFNITVLNNTSPGNYSIWIDVNWTNRVPPDSSNSTWLNITVHENPLLDVLQENVTGILPPGATNQVIESLLVRSIGNNDTLNVSLYSGGLSNFSIEFFPQNISVMAPGEEQAVQVRATVPAGQFPGIYEGEINVTSDNGGYETLNTTIIVTGTNLTINTTPDDYSAQYVTAYSFETFEFAVNVTNTGNTTAFNTYVNVTLPGNWFINETNQSCGNLTKGSTCMSYFFVNITELTQAGDYEINVTIFWEDIGISWRSESDPINVTVVSNVTLEVKEDQFEKTMEHGTSILIGDLNLRSTGNDDVLNVDFNLSSELDNFTIEFNQSYPFTMTPGDFRTIMINATIPLGFDPGDYDGYLNVTSSNDGYKIVYINITVPQNGSWSVNTTFCEHSQSPSSGKVCDVLITNLGNILLNFSIDPAAGANHTTPSSGSINISKQNSSILSILYDMGGEAGSGYFLTNYTITPNQTAGEPDNVTLEIILNPYVAPLIEVGVTPVLEQQGGSVQMVINITSQSGADLDEKTLTVQRPNGTNDTLQLGFSNQVFWLGCDFIISDPDDKLCYVVDYPSDLSGNITARGNYTIFVYSNDTYGVNGTNTSQFRIYTRYLVDLDMPDSVQGSWESINYRARDYLGAGLPGASVNLTVRDPNNRLVYMLSGKEYTTDSQGWVGDNIFVIPAHATEGEYTVYSNGSYIDPDVGLIVWNETSTNFNVTEDPTLIAEVAIPSPVVVDSMIPISVITLQNFQPVDPDDFEVDIYYTEGYQFTLWRHLELSDFTRNTTGFYQYQEVVDNVLTGTYVALLKASRSGVDTYDIHAFRIAQSGPYDVIVSLDQDEIEPGNVLYFNITIWNKGEVDNEDVVVDYWVQGGGRTWDSGQLTPNIGAGQQLVFRPTDGLFIWSHQPAGSYTVQVRVTYDPSIPPANASAGFVVVGEGKEKPPEEDEGGGGGGEGAPEGPSAGPSGQINITSIPAEVGVMAGLPKQFNMKVKAVGGSVTNVWFDFRGIPRSWLMVEPSNITRIASGETRTITVQITVPRGETGERDIKVIARSTESTDDEDLTLRIFTSKKDLINFELVRLRAKLEELRDRADQAAQAGFDVSRVDDLLDDAEKEINLAESYLREELYDAALDSVYTAWRLLDDAEELLDRMLAGVAMPWWLILIIVFALIIAGLFFLYRRISKNLSILIRGRMSEARQVAGTVKGVGVETEKLREEKQKTERMILLLQSQFKQGIISKEAYESLKKRSDQRIAELDKKIRESLKT